MHPLRQVLVVAGFVWLAGCSEVTTTGDRPVSIDVVGDPRDQSYDNSEKSDIYGSGNPSQHEPEVVADTKSNVISDPPREPLDAAEPEESNAPSEVGVTKPVSLKTSNSDSKK